MEDRPGSEYDRFCTLMQLIEGRAALQRSERLTLCQGSEIVGSMMFEAGRIHFGVQLREQVVIDETFRSEAPRLAEAVWAILNHQSLARAAQTLAAPLDPLQQAALCGLTARTLRTIAMLHQPDAEVISTAEIGRPFLGLFKVLFSPLDLMLAAGRRGSIDYADPAVCLYGAPPGHAEERWLFERQLDGAAPQAWPIMTTRIGNRSIDNIAAFGLLGQRLLRTGAGQVQNRDSGGRRAILLHIENKLLLLFSSGRYSTLLVYPGSFFEHLLRWSEALPLQERKLSDPEVPKVEAWPSDALKASSDSSSIQPAVPALVSLPAERAALDPTFVLWEHTESTAPPILCLRGFSVFLGSRCVVSGLRCDVARPGTYLLLCPDGGEKRVLIRALCGPRPAQLQLSGSAHYLGQSLLQAVGPVTPRSSAQQHMMTVCDFLISNLLSQDALPRVDLVQQVKELVCRYGLSDLVERFSDLLANVDPAERRLLEIIRAVAPQPAMLVLDEPLADMKPLVVPRLLALLRIQAQERALLIFAQEAGPLVALTPQVGVFTGQGLTCR